MGEVFLVYETAKGGEDMLVLKSVLCANNGDAKEALKEAKVLKDISHPHIVRYLDVFPNQEAYKGIIAVCTVMEYCAGGDLAMHLSNFKKQQVGRGEGLKERVIVTWTGQLLQALEYMHARNIIHRDMKPHNVFISRQSNLKIGDFGLAKMLAKGKATSRVGTPAYIAPEVLQYDGYGPSVDVWGVGCLAYEMMSLDFLSERKGMLASEVQRQRVRQRDLPAAYNAGLRDVVASLLLADPAARPTAASTLQKIEEMTKHLGGAPAAYMDLQEQAAKASWGAGGGERGGVEEEEEEAAAAASAASWRSSAPLLPQEHAAHDSLSGLKASSNKPALLRKTPNRRAANAPSFVQNITDEETDHISESEPPPLFAAGQAVSSLYLKLIGYEALSYQCMRP
jgi:serine/threonine protein kinase